MFSWAKDKLFIEWVKRFKYYIPPDSSGKNEVEVFDYMDKGLRISGVEIDHALSYARGMRTGFIRGDHCYSLPTWLIDTIWQTEFDFYMKHYFKKKK